MWVYPWRSLFKWALLLFVGLVMSFDEWDWEDFEDEWEDWEWFCEETPWFEDCKEWFEDDE